MIVEQLRSEITKALSMYVRRYSSTNLVPLSRVLDIHNIKDILQESNPISMCTALNKYISKISISFLTWLTFIDVNAFVMPIKKVLQQEKYQEINLLRTLLREKQELLETLSDSTKVNVPDKSMDDRIENISKEITYLKGENNYLYATLDELHKKISAIEVENIKNLKRADEAEEELKKYRKKYGSLKSISVYTSGEKLELSQYDSQSSVLS